MQRIRALLIFLVLVALAAMVLLLVKVVPDGRMGVLERGSAAETLRPGLHATSPGGRLTLYAAGPRTLVFPAPDDTAGGVYRVFSEEGAEIRVSVSLRYTVSAESLLVFHRAARGRGDAAVRDVLKAELRNIAAAFPAGTLTEPSGFRFRRALSAALASRLAVIGVRPGELGCEAALAPGGGMRLARAHADSRARRVLVLGVDAADWTIINRLRAAGRLPALERAIRGGASGPLRSIEPLLSPLIWTTIATGVGPERHGILDFLTPDPVTGKPVPATSRLRAAPALWNLAPAFGKRTGVVGWLATWPAEPIDGFLVTDRFGFLAFAGQVGGDPSAADLTQPADLLADRGDRAVSSESVSDETLRRFIDVPIAEIAAARRPGYEKGNSINNFIHTLATADSYARVGLDLYRDERPDLMMIYFEFLDATSHLFMPFAPPRRPDVSEADLRRFGHAVDEAYRHQDEILDTFLKQAGDSTIVILLSDHGFRSGQARLAGGAGMEEANAARWHLPEGVLILDGPGVRRGFTLSGASVFDIAPTILAVLGGPIPSSFEGRVLREAFEDGFFTGEDTLRMDDVPTSGYAPPQRGEVGESGSDGGGIASRETAAPGSDNAGETAKHVNLGIVLARDGDPRGAEAEFRKALALSPLSRIAANNLASIMMQQERYDEARAVLEELLAEDAGYALGWSNLGVCEQRLGHGPEALTCYARSLSLEPADQRTLMNRGFLFLDLKRPAEAETDFRKSLDITPGLAAARFGLGAALFEQGRSEEAGPELEAAIKADPGHNGARRLLEQIRSAPGGN